MATSLEVLGLRVDLDTKDAKRDMDRLEKAISARTTDLDKGAKKLNKGIEKFAHQYVTVRRTAIPMLKDVTKSYNKLERSIADINHELERSRGKLASASGDSRKNVEKEIKDWEKLRDAREKALDTMTRVKEDLETRIVFDKDEFVGAMKEAGQELYEPIDRLISKDLPGAFESGGKLLGKGVEGVFKGGSWLAKVGGKFGERAGASMMSKGKMSMARGGIMGKLGGAAQVAGGGAMQGVGKLAGGLAPILDIVSKLGPLLGVVSTVMVGLVKLFVDAEAAAKDFNKEILATSGSASFLYSNFNNVNAGAGELGDTLKKIRDQATSLDNMSWGINKDTHKAVLSSLTAEGVSLRRLNDDFEATSKSSKEAAGYAKSFGSTVQMAVAYSRNLGVSLSDIGNLQAEMMTDMGMGLKSVELNFTQMSRAAEDGGIASNKFFGIIRGVSADLALYNTRMEDAVKILGLLGKVMSPRNAQKFMQTATQALKGMGRVERLKTNLLGGGKMGGMVEKDLDRKSKDVSGKIAEAGGKAGYSREDLMSKPIKELMQGVSKEAQGTLHEAISEMRMDAKANKKGVFGSSVAGRNLGPGAALQSMKSALNIGGSGKLRDRRGDLGTEMLADANGISEDQLAQMAKFEEAIDEQRDELKADLKAGGDKQAAAMKRLDKAGVAAADIDTAGYDDILATLDQSEQDALKDGAKQIDYAKETGKFQTSLMDKIGNVAEFIMNQIYTVLTGIWDALVDSKIFGNDEKRKQRDLSKTVREGKDSDTQKALGASGGDEFKFRGELMQSQGMKQIVDAMTKGGQSGQAAQRKMQENASPQEMRRAVIDALGEGGLYGGQDKLDAANKEADRLKLDPGTRQEFMNQKKGKAGIVGFDGSIDTSKFSKDDMDKIMAKLGWEMDPTKLAKIFPDLKAMTGGSTSPSSSPDSPAPQEAPPQAMPPGVSGPPLPPGAAGGAAPGAPPLPKDAPTAGQQDHVIKGLDGAQDTLRKQGIVIDKAFLKNKMGQQMEDSFLEALRQGLYEYYLYKDLKQESVSKAVQGGISGRGLGAALADKLGQGITADTAITQLSANATGGVVSAVANGMAQLRPAPGEGLASIGVGEKIVPAGGGSGTQKIVLELRGDLKRLVRAEASNTFYENEGAKKNR
jgi:hypothetical protein